MNRDVTVAKRRLNGWYGAVGFFLVGVAVLAWSEYAAWLRGSMIGLVGLLVFFRLVGRRFRIFWEWDADSGDVSVRWAGRNWSLGRADRLYDEESRYLIRAKGKVIPVRFYKEEVPDGVRQILDARLPGKTIRRKFRAQKRATLRSRRFWAFSALAAATGGVAIYYWMTWIAGAKEDFFSYDEFKHHEYRQKQLMLYAFIYTTYGLAFLSCAVRGAQRIAWETDDSGVVTIFQYGREAWEWEAVDVSEEDLSTFTLTAPNGKEWRIEKRLLPEEMRVAIETRLDE